MLKRCERYYKVFAPAGEFMGCYPLSLSFRTSEEVESGDVIYTNLRLSAFADKRRSPAGGYRRGMILTDLTGTEVYHVLVPISFGRSWNLKLERVLQNGDGEAV